jgi:hypothetical protein
MQISLCCSRLYLWHRRAEGLEEILLKGGKAMRDMHTNGSRARQFDYEIKTTFLERYTKFLLFLYGALKVGGAIDRHTAALSSSPRRKVRQ